MATVNLTGVVSKQIQGKNSVYLTIVDFGGELPIKVGIPVQLAEKDLHVPLQITLEGFSCLSGDRGMYFKAEKFHAEKLVSK